MNYKSRTDACDGMVSDDYVHECDARRNIIFDSSRMLHTAWPWLPPGMVISRCFGTIPFRSNTLETPWQEKLYSHENYVH